MSKMSEQSTAVAELHKCGEALIEISQTRCAASAGTHSADRYTGRSPGGAG